MKLNIKNILACAVIGMGGMGLTSCNDFLDREPIASVTPEHYFKTADQVGAYVNNYFNGSLRNSQNQELFHGTSWNAGVACNDNNTDNYLKGNGDLGWFAVGRRQVPAGQNLIGDYGNVRVWNYFINTVESKVADNTLTGTPADVELIQHYLGEGYFFRALTYYNMLVRFGDLPIIKEVLKNEEEPLKAASVRSPRNEVARFILSDLDTAISKLKEVGFQNNQRINKQVALLFKSRVALFEGTFEKYHRGSGRIPGDQGWPGKEFSGNIDSEIEFFLTQAMEAAKQVADATVLTPNSHKINPAYGEIYGWNPYFEMFSQPSLKGVDEVLLWKEYNKGFNISHNAPNRLNEGDNAGFLRSAMTAFLCKDGLPIYASPLYQGDANLDKEFTDRDERLKLFAFDNSTVLKSDLAEKIVADTGKVILLDKPHIAVVEQQVRNITGYRQRKHYCYDYTQKSSDELLGRNACPIFRSAEALLNYMEADYVLDNSLDATSKGYWKQLRARAGVSEDIDKTIAATDMAKEVEYQDLGAWSGDKMVDATLFNIRRERRCEFIGEGMRWDDLKRWRSFDRLLVKKFVPEGFNLWEEQYKLYDPEKKGEKIVAEGTQESNCSQKSQGNYLLPCARWKDNNELYDGYGWTKAYYLDPIGIEELKLAPELYQNPFWPSETAGQALE